jgi:hypothetical protein
VLRGCRAGSDQGRPGQYPAIRRRCAIKIVRNDPRELVLNLGFGISVRCLWLMLPLGGIFVDVAGALRIEGMDRAEVVIMAVRIRALPPSATAY